MTRPSVEQLWADPELAALPVREAAANVASLALRAEYPALASDDVDRRASLELAAAVDIIKLARAVDLAIVRYRCVLAERRERERQREEAELLAAF